MWLWTLLVSKALIGAGVLKSDDAVMILAIVVMIVGRVRFRTTGFYELMRLMQ